MCLLLLRQATATTLHHTTWVYSKHPNGNTNVSQMARSVYYKAQAVVVGVVVVFFFCSCIQKNVNEQFKRKKNYFILSAREKKVQIVSYWIPRFCRKILSISPFVVSMHFNRWTYRHMNNVCDDSNKFFFWCRCKVLMFARAHVFCASPKLVMETETVR